MEDVKNRAENASAAVENRAQAWIALFLVAFATLSILLPIFGAVLGFSLRVFRWAAGF